MGPQYEERREYLGWSMNEIAIQANAHNANAHKTAASGGMVSGCAFLFAF